MSRSHVTRLWCILLAFVVSGCTADSDTLPTTGPTEPTSPQNCTIPQSLIFTAAPAKDWIPALTNPEFVPPGDAALSYLRDFDRVIGIVLDGQAYAIPLNIMWWHEIVNLDVGGHSLAITHCPLTGSSLVFDRAPLDGVEFGVSGLLYFNNLIMYDRSTGESLWPQMARGARCGVQSGTALRSVASIEMRWDRWRQLYPATVVVSERTGFQRGYDQYPYGDYAEPPNEATLFPRGQNDDRLLPKELVLGVPDGADTWALPLSRLETLGSRAAVYPSEDSPDLVVLWDSSAESAMAYRSLDPSGERLTLRLEGGRVVDEETGSTWQIDGRATSGPLVGTQLEPIPEAYLAFWFAWIDFHPQTLLWEPPQ